MEHQRNSRFYYQNNSRNMASNNYGLSNQTTHQSGNINLQISINADIISINQQHMNHNNRAQNSTNTVSINTNSTQQSLISQGRANNNSNNQTNSINQRASSSSSNNAKNSSNGQKNAGSNQGKRITLHSYRNSQGEPYLRIPREFLNRFLFDIDVFLKLNEFCDKFSPSPKSYWLLHPRYHGMSREERTQKLEDEDRRREVIRGVEVIAIPASLLFQPSSTSPPTSPFFTTNSFDIHPFTSTSMRSIMNNALPDYLKKLSRREASVYFGEYLETASPELVEMSNKIDLLSHLQCPVCLDTAFPPLLTCRNSHILCKGCREQIFLPYNMRPRVYNNLDFFYNRDRFRNEESMPRCPVCRICLVSSLMENTKLVEEAAGLNFKCLYSSRGCNSIISYSTYTTHVDTTCTQRPFGCAFCEEILEIPSLVPHYLSKHSDLLSFSLLSYKNSFFMRVPMKDHGVPIAYGFFYNRRIGRMFVVYQLELYGNCYVWLPTIVGTPEEAALLRADFEMVTKYDMGSKVGSYHDRGVWKNVPLASAQLNMRAILEFYSTVQEDAGNVPIYNYYKNELNSGGKHAHQFSSTLYISIQSK